MTVGLEEAVSEPVGEMGGSKPVVVSETGVALGVTTGDVEADAAGADGEAHVGDDGEADAGVVVANEAVDLVAGSAAPNAADDAETAGDDGGHAVGEVILPSPSVRLLSKLLVGHRWQGTFSSYREFRGAVELNKPFSVDHLPAVVSEPIPEGALAVALANAKAMQASLVAPGKLAAAQAQTDGLEDYYASLRELAAGDHAGMAAAGGSDSGDGEPTPQLDMSAPRLTEASKPVELIRDGQLDDPRCRRGEEMLKAVQRGMDATGGCCMYCNKRVAWRVVVDNATGRLEWRCAANPADGDRCEQDHAGPASLGGIAYEGNLFPACSACNALKGNRSLWDFVFMITSDPALAGKRRFDDVASFVESILDAAWPYLAILSEREWETLVMGVRPVTRVESWMEQQVMLGARVEDLVASPQLAYLDTVEKTYAEPLDVDRRDFSVIAHMLRAGSFSSSKHGSGVTIPVSEFCSLLTDAGSMSADDPVEDLRLRVAAAATHGAVVYSGKGRGPKWTLLMEVLGKYVDLAVEHGVYDFISERDEQVDVSASVMATAYREAMDEVNVLSGSRQDVLDAMGAVVSMAAVLDDDSLTGNGDSFEWTNKSQLKAVSEVIYCLQIIVSDCKSSSQKPSKRLVLSVICSLAKKLGYSTLMTGMVDAEVLALALPQALVDVGAISLSLGDWMEARRIGGVQSQSCINTYGKIDCMAAGFASWLWHEDRLAGGWIRSVNDADRLDLMLFTRGMSKVNLALLGSPLMEEYKLTQTAYMDSILTDPRASVTNITKLTMLAPFELQYYSEYGSVTGLGDALKTLRDPSTPVDKLEALRGELTRVMGDALVANGLVDPLTGKKWSARGMTDQTSRNKVSDKNKDLKKRITPLMALPEDSPVRFLSDYVMDVCRDRRAVVASREVRLSAIVARELPDGVTAAEALEKWETEGIDLRGAWASSETGESKAARRSLKCTTLGCVLAAYNRWRAGLSEIRRKKYCTGDTLAKAIMDTLGSIGMEPGQFDEAASEEVVGDFVDGACKLFVKDKSTNVSRALDWLFDCMASSPTLKNATAEAAIHGKYVKDRKLDGLLYDSGFDAESRLKIKKLDAIANAPGNKIPGPGSSDDGKAGTIVPVIDAISDELLQKARSGALGPVSFGEANLAKLASSCLHGTGKKDRSASAARKEYARLTTVLRWAEDEAGLVSIECEITSYDKAISMADPKRCRQVPNMAQAHSRAASELTSSL